MKTKQSTSFIGSKIQAPLSPVLSHSFHRLTPNSFLRKMKCLGVPLHNDLLLGKPLWLTGI